MKFTTNMIHTTGEELQALGAEDGMDLYEYLQGIAPRYHSTELACLEATMMQLELLYDEDWSNI